MKKQEFLKHYEAISDDLTKEIRECSVMDIQRIDCLQQRRKAIEFAKFLVSLYSNERLGLIKKMFNRSQQLISPSEAKQAEMF